MDQLIQILGVALVSFIAWTLSALAGGGSPFVLIPLINLVWGVAAVPPVITVGMLVGNGHRTWLFWRQVDWYLTAWYAPGAIVGAVLGAFAFTQIHLDWLELLLGLFLVFSLLACGLEPKPGSFQVKAWHILPAGFCKAFVSGLIGTTGPVLNPFYLNYGLVKEQLIATKAVHMVIIHCVKILTYAGFGAISGEEFWAGLAVGVMAVPANLLGKWILARINPQQFRRLVLGMMALSGLWMLWSEREFLWFW